MHVEGKSLGARVCLPTHVNVSIQLPAAAHVTGTCARVARAHGPAHVHVGMRACIRTYAHTRMNACGRSRWTKHASHLYLDRYTMMAATCVYMNVSTSVYMNASLARI